MDGAPLVDLAPLARLALLGVVLALGPLAWVWLRHRGADPARRLHALTLLTLFLTFDLVLFGAFTRLTDSGLGCPDWPGCYGSASPVGAQAQIEAAQAAQPTGPVTHGKAWIEMVHRYLATAVGVLITVLALASWLEARSARRAGRVPALAPGWAFATLAWVCVQGAFGAYTVTLKLYPAIVTAHLLGGLMLLVLLSALAAQALPRPRAAVGRGLRAGLWSVAALAALQIALGGWVSTNYAVLACQDFPTCQGQWWPPADFAHGFTLLRPLGTDAHGSWLSFAALTAIHLAHRLGALILLPALGLLAWRMARHPALRRLAAGLAAVAAWQLATGVSNVVLGWPLLAAVGHTGGAALLALLLTRALLRSAATAAAARQATAALPVAAAARGTP